MCWPKIIYGYLRLRELMKVLITGASGFVGRAVFGALKLNSEYEVRGTARANTKQKNDSLIEIGDISAVTGWSAALHEVDVVVHLAARAHVLNDNSADPLAEFRRVNVDGALALAEQALTAGVKRFVFISSIGVNGTQTTTEAFDESSVLAPQFDYALSKLEAEQGLKSLLQGTEMELVIIRPPLVYSGHAPGNFQRLLKLVASGAPLPFASVNNQRSLVALDNLVDFIACCVEHPAAANELFLISDGIDVSTPEMLGYLSEGMGQKPRALSLPNGLMRWGATLLGKKTLYTQLCGSLVVDSSKARELLGWQPPVTPREALIKAGHEFKASRDPQALRALPN